MEQIFLVRTFLTEEKLKLLSKKKYRFLIIK